MGIDTIGGEKRMEKALSQEFPPWSRTHMKL